MSTIGIPGLILILLVALILFGPNKLPQLGRSIGQSIREFKTSTEGLLHDGKKENK